MQQPQNPCNTSSGRLNARSFGGSPSSDPQIRISSSRIRGIVFQKKYWILRAGVPRTNGLSDHHLVGAVSYRMVFYVVARPCGTIPHRAAPSGGGAYQRTIASGSFSDSIVWTENIS